MNYRYVGALLLAIVLVSCGTNAKRENDDPNSLQVDKYNVKVGDKLSSEDWNCEPVADDNICFPKIWRPVDQERFSFFSYLDNEDENTFFVVVKYDLNDLGISDRDYLKEVYNQLLADTTETFKEYSFKELVYEEQNSAYYGEFGTEINGKEYFTYTMYTAKNGNLFDITLKVDMTEKDEYYGQFQNILYNIRTSGEYLFDFKEEIVEIKFIDFDTF